MANKVEIYVTNYCPYCHAAKDLLKSKGVQYTEIDVTDKPDVREKLVTMTGGKTTVPQIFVDGKNIGGYDDLVAFYKAGKTIE